MKRSLVLAMVVACCGAGKGQVASADEPAWPAFQAPSAITHVALDDFSAHSAEPTLETVAWFENGAALQSLPPEIRLAGHDTSELCPTADAVTESDEGVNGCDGSCWRCEADEHKNTGFLDLNYFWDERGANWFTVYAMANLPHDFTYFQLLNLVGQFDQSSEAENLVDFYTEQNLWYPIAKNSDLLGAFDYSVQWVDASYLDPLLRFGVQWRVKDTSGPLGELLTNVLDLDYRVYFHAIETDGSGIQIEHFYLRQFCDGRFYVRGFLDHDVNTDGTSDFVSGAQTGVKLIGGLHLAAEHRYNSFQTPGNKSGWKLGLQYNIQFP